MVESVSSLFSPQQITLTAVIVVACAGLAWTRQGGSTDFEELHERGWRLTVGAVVAAVAVFLFLRCGNPIGIRVDSWSDANVIVSGRNYARMGLFSNYGAAQHQVVSQHHPNDPFYIYTNYPVLPNLISGLWHSAGVTSVRAHRLLPAACSILAILVWLAIYRRFCDDSVAALAAIVMATSYAFLAYADNLHFHAYAHLSSALALLFFIRAAHADARHRNRDLRFSAVAVFVTALLTWEYHLYLVLFILLYPLFFPCALPRSRALLVLLPLALAFGLQLLQRKAALSGIATGTTDSHAGFLHDIHRRTLGFRIAADSPEGLTLLNYPLHVATSFFNLFGIPLLAFVALTAATIIPTVGKTMPAGVSSKPARLILLLLVSGLGWWLTMFQHTAVHSHVMRHFLPVYAIVLAMIGLRCWRLLQSSSAPIVARIAAAALLAAMLYAHAEGSLFNLRLHFSGDRVDSRKRNDGGWWERELLEPLADCVPPDAVILTNLNRLPLLRYWTRRPAYWASPVRLPLHDQERGRWTIDLSFNHVRELYPERFPPLYFVYYFWQNSMDQAFAEDAYLRFLTTGSTQEGDGRWQAARPVLEEAVAHGGSNGAFCRIVCGNREVICFDLANAVPGLHRDFDKNGYPSPGEFGQPR